MTDLTDLSCACGETRLRVQGDPIMSVECLCESCRTASAQLAALPGLPPLADGRGATRYVMYRKDRMECAGGAEHLKEHRLTPGSKTRRVVATCCNTPMFLEFTSGHWLSLYGALWPDGSQPRLYMRTMTKDAPEAPLPTDVPNAKTHTAGFMAKLLGAWVVMGFRAPKIDYVQGKLEVR